MGPRSAPKAARAAAAMLLVPMLACGGDDEPAAGPAGPVTELTITSPDLSFSVERFEVPAGEEVRITYVNEDEGVQHNIHFDTGQDPEPATLLVEGPDTQELAFTLEAGEVTYICDLHPAQMRGEVTAR